VQRILNSIDMVQHLLYISLFHVARQAICPSRRRVRESRGQSRSRRFSLVASEKQDSRTAEHAIGAREEKTALEQRFARSQEKLSPGRRQLLRVILENPEDAYFLSSREMAKRYHVDAATIVRTIQALGYHSFAEFVADLRSHFVRRITPYMALKAASREKKTVTDRVRQRLELDLRNLQSLQLSMDAKQVNALSKRVKQSQRIVVVGIDLAAALSWYLSYGLMTLGFAAEAPVGSTGNVQRRVRTLTRRDLLIAISFGKCLRDTVEAAQRAKKQGVPTVGITDSETTPIALVCDESFIVPVASSSFGATYVAPLALIGAILVACAQIQTSRSLQLLRRGEEEDRTDHRWFDAS
jgi:DNA-binding MurR/RpiR family transcriptional regulator